MVWHTTRHPPSTTHITLWCILQATVNVQIYDNFSGHIFSKHNLYRHSRLILLHIALSRCCRCSSTVCTKSGRIFVSRTTSTHLAVAQALFREHTLDSIRNKSNSWLEQKKQKRNEIYEIFVPSSFLFEIVCTIGVSREIHVVCAP